MIYAAASSGFWRFGFDGALLGSYTVEGAQMADAYVDADGAHFAAVGDVEVYRFFH